MAMLGAMKWLPFSKAAGRGNLPSTANLDSVQERDRLWAWGLHEDNLLSTRVSVFLLAQSILIAVTAAVINTFAGFRSSQHLLRAEVFGLAIALNLAGIALTLIFWYILGLNYRGVKILAARLRSLDEMYEQLDTKRREDRADYWPYRVIFHRGANDIINNFLPFVILLIWCLIAAFSVVIFVS
jgi:hypothetical protein